MQSALRQNYGENMRGSVHGRGGTDEGYADLFFKKVSQLNEFFEIVDKAYRDPQGDQHANLDAAMKVLFDFKSACKLFEQVYADNPQAVRDAKKAFREQTDKHFSKSALMHRARTWPEGYPGDYKTLEIIYRNTSSSKGVGDFLDRYGLSSTLAVAIRGRLKKLSDILKNEMQSRSQPKVLDVACGSCREIFDIAPEFIHSGAHVICVDHDLNALKFASERLGCLEQQDKIRFKKYNAFKMVNHERNVKEFGFQDIIYSTGFYDYVEDAALMRLLNAAYQLLNPGGTLIASFKDRNRYDTPVYHWFVNWDAFFQRTEKDMDALFDGAGLHNATIEKMRDESGVILFYLVTKR